MEIKWIDGSEISVSYDQLQDEVVINANREGLLSLAGQLIRAARHLQSAGSARRRH